MRRVLALSLLGLVAASPATSQVASSEAAPANTIRFYMDVGRIKWTFPHQENFIFGVPHFTVGPRVLCTRNIGAECEIEVSARQLWTTVGERRKELLATVAEYLPDALEQSPQILSLGSLSVEYFVLTHKKDGGKVAFGFATHGPYAIR